MRRLVVQILAGIIAAVNFGAWSYASVENLELAVLTATSWGGAVLILVHLGLKTEPVIISRPDSTIEGILTGSSIGLATVVAGRGVGIIPSLSGNEQWALSMLIIPACLFSFGAGVLAVRTRQDEK